MAHRRRTCMQLAAKAGFLVSGSKTRRTGEPKARKLRLWSHAAPSFHLGRVCREKARKGARLSCPSLLSGSPKRGISRALAPSGKHWQALASIGKHLAALDGSSLLLSPPKFPRVCPACRRPIGQTSRMRREHREKARQPERSRHATASPPPHLRMRKWSEKCSSCCAASKWPTSSLRRGNATVSGGNGRSTRRWQRLSWLRALSVGWIPCGFRVGRERGRRGG